MLEVSPLLPAHQAALGLHLLSLSSDDRYERFGMALKDEALLAWACSIDWQTQRWWGARLPEHPGLIGALQLSPLRLPDTWELAMTVSASVRHRGVATRLLSAAVAQTPEAEHLVCQHGHAAILAMAKRLGYQSTIQAELTRLSIRNSDGFI